MGYGIPIWTRDWDGITAAAFGRLQPRADISPERPIVGFLNTLRGVIDAAVAGLTDEGAICGAMAMITDVRLTDEKQHNYLDGIDGLDMWQIHRHYFHTNPWTDLLGAQASAYQARWIIPITLPTGIGAFQMDFTYGASTLWDDTVSFSTDMTHHLYTIYGSKLEGVQEYITRIEVYAAATRDKWKIPVNGRLDALLIQTQNGTPVLDDWIISDIEVSDGGIPQVAGILDDLRGWGETWQEQGMPLTGVTNVIDGWPMDPCGIYFLNFDSFVPDQTAMIKYSVAEAADEIKFIMKYTQPQVEVTSQVVTPAVAADNVKTAISEGEMAKDVVRPPVAAPSQIRGPSTGYEPSAVPSAQPVRKTRRGYQQTG